MILTHLRIELCALLRSLYVDLASAVQDRAQITADAIVARHLCRVVPYHDPELRQVLERLEAGSVPDLVEMGEARRVLRDAADRL